MPTSSPHVYLEGVSNSNCKSTNYFVLSEAPNEGQDEGRGFPSLVDWITLGLDMADMGTDYDMFLEILKVHYNSIVNTITDSIKVLDETHLV